MIVYLCIFLHTQILDEQKRSVLFCVVGGKLSEGINFSDNMARCVVIIGLPFPNPHDVELKMHMEFAESISQGAGRRMYDSLCLRAVNQAIGRSIRHRGDYACVILLDERYSHRNITTQLSSWLQPFISTCRTWAETLRSADQFFDTTHPK